MDVVNNNPSVETETLDSKTVIYSTPKEYLKMNIDDWESFLRSDVSDFDGNVENAAFLLWYFSEGAKDTYKENSVDSPLPLILARTANPNTTFLSSDEFGLVIGLTQLEKDSLIDFREDVIIQVLGETKFIGKVGNYFRLGGAEEAKHHEYRQKNGKTGVYESGTTTTIAEYDARDVEYDALEWQIKYADKKSMGRDTVNVLQKRYDDATAFREAKK